MHIEFINGLLNGVGTIDWMGYVAKLIGGFLIVCGIRGLFRAFFSGPVSGRVRRDIDDPDDNDPWLGWPK